MKIKIRNDERGVATLIFFSLMAIMMILVVAETRALIHLRREVKFLEHRQILRLNGPSTSAPASILPAPVNPPTQ